jgi:hypothetical protein
MLLALRPATPAQKAPRFRSVSWRIRNVAAVSRCRSHFAEFVKYHFFRRSAESLPTLMVGKPFSSDAQRMPNGNGNCMGDEGKAAGNAQAPAALLSVFDSQENVASA